MPIGAAAIIGAGTLGAGFFGANAAQSAASTQAKAANQAAGISANEFLSTQQQLQPFKDLGGNAAALLGQLFGLTTGPGQTSDPRYGSLYGSISSQIGAPPSPTDPSLTNQFRASPGYQYALGQSSNAIQNSAAGRTGAVSGNMLKALQTNATGLADQDYSNFYNNLVNNYSTRYNDVANNRNQIVSVLSALGGQGENAAAQTGTFGANAASSIGNNLNLAGSAQAAGTLGSANALTTALNSLSGNPSVNSALSFLFNGGSGGGGSGYGNGDFGGGGSF